MPLLTATGPLVNRSTPSESSEIAEPAMSAMLSKRHNLVKVNLFNWHPMTAASALSASRRKMRSGRSPCVGLSNCRGSESLPRPAESGAWFPRGPLNGKDVRRLRSHPCTFSISTPNRGSPSVAGLAHRLGRGSRVEQGGQNHVAANTHWRAIKMSHAHQPILLCRQCTAHKWPRRYAASGKTKNASVLPAGGYICPAMRKWLPRRLLPVIIPINFPRIRFPSGFRDRLSPGNFPALLTEEKHAIMGIISRKSCRGKGRRYSPSARMRRCWKRPSS